jgi:DNA polymerase V
MTTLEMFTPELEIYSIDEAFLLLTGFKDRDLMKLGREIRDTVVKWTGIPVSVGIGGTKTLAKIANHIAKRYKKFESVFSIYKHPDIDTVLNHVTVDKIWGVGPQYSRFLMQNKINTARELRDADSQWIRKYMTVVGQRTALELKGISCIDLDMVVEPKKGIVSSRSFGNPVTSLSELEEAVSTYMTRACEKLRHQRSIASYITVFLGTNRFKSEPQYSNSLTTQLREPSAYTPEMIRVAHQLLRAIYRPQFRYKKAGVMLGQIINQFQVPPDAFEPAYVDDRRKAIMDAVDHINERMGRDTLYYASCGKQQHWQMRREKLSPKYTTKWCDIPKVK